MHGNLLYQWHFNAGVLLLSGVIVFLYNSYTRFRERKNNSCFFSALALFILADSSPLHFLGMHYYFFAHMIVHVIILLICGPLLVISFSETNREECAAPLKKFSSFTNRYPALCWLTGAGIMWLWHIPKVFDHSFGGMQFFSISALLHPGSMLLAGVIFSWPLFGAVKKFNIHPLGGVLYLFTACISCSLLGLLITFAPLQAYHHYLEAAQSMNMPGMNPFNISAAADLQAAGLIMWVPCCLVYLAGCMLLLKQYFSSPDETGGIRMVAN